MYSVGIDIVLYNIVSIKYTVTFSVPQNRSDEIKMYSFVIHITVTTKFLRWTYNNTFVVLTEQLSWVYYRREPIQISNRSDGAATNCYLLVPTQIVFSFLRLETPLFHANQFGIKPWSL